MMSTGIGFGIGLKRKIVIPVPPVTGDYILLESGDELLLENDQPILLEKQNE